MKVVDRNQSVSTFSTTLHEMIAMHLRQITMNLFSIMNKCYVFPLLKVQLLLHIHTSYTYSCHHVTVQEECGTLANSSLV